MTFPVMMRLKEHYCILENRPPVGTIIQCASEVGPGCGGPSRETICRTLRAMGYEAEVNDGVCGYYNWELTWL